MSEQTSEKKPGWKCLILMLAITLGGGILVALFTRNSMDFYDTLSKPVFAPPGWLFPVAWSILYTLIAIAIWLVLRTGLPQRSMLLVLYFIQLAVNLIWPFLFFVQQALGLSFVWLLLLWALIIILLTKTYQVQQTAAWLLAPYLLWVTFAGVLNFVLAQMNP